MHTDEHMRRSLGFLVPGFTQQQMRQAVGASHFDSLMSATKPFNQDDFIEELIKKRQTDAIDLSHMSNTEKAFHLVFDPDRHVRSDYEAMIFPQEYKKDPKEEEGFDQPRPSDLQKQYCDNPLCPGIDNKWIKCSSKKNLCWYHFSCAGIPANKTQEEIEQMEWYCQKCRKVKGTKRR